MGSSSPDFGPTMVSSAVAGVVGRLFCHPLDTCKARLQVQTLSAAHDSSMYRHTADALVRTARHEGLRGLYRGFSVAAVGGAPATCLYLTSYELFAAQLNGLGVFEPAAGAAPSAAVPFCAGMLAETLSCLLWVPIDVIKERLQVQNSPGARAANSAAGYRGPLHAGRAILRHEGARGLYKGYAATLLSFGPFSALYFGFYAPLKELAAPKDASAEPSVLATLGAAALAGSLASFLTNPLDLVKLRLQVQRGAAAGGGGAGATTYRGVGHGLGAVVKAEGVAGLFKGAGARVAFHAPSTAITMTAFEKIKAMILARQQFED